MKCKYCGGSFPQNLVPWKIKYSVGALKKFISDDPETVIAFYGGEPLLNPKFIKKIMDELPDAKFVIQTNGVATKMLKSEYWSRFDAVLLSIDGRRNVTDCYRGASVYDKVLNSAKWLRTIGFGNDLIARMTVSTHSDLFLDVDHLLSLKMFDHVHWQLDAVWNSHRNGFCDWCESSYMPGVTRLVQLWVEEARNGVVLGIVPFLAVLSMMVEGGRIDCPPCGSGVNSLSILPDGDVIACPIAVDVKWGKLGNINQDSMAQLVNKTRISEPCTKCDYLRYCGGRCLYAHYERLWGEEGFSMMCRTTIHLINELARIKDEVSNLLQKNVISMKQLDYPPFNNTTEIIP